MPHQNQKNTFFKDHPQPFHLWPGQPLQKGETKLFFACILNLHVTKQVDFELTLPPSNSVFCHNSFCHARCTSNSGPPRVATPSSGARRWWAERYDYSPYKKRKKIFILVFAEEHGEGHHSGQVPQQTRVASSSRPKYISPTSSQISPQNVLYTT